MLNGAESTICIIHPVQRNQQMILNLFSMGFCVNYHWQAATLVSVQRNCCYLGDKVLGVEFLIVGFVRRRTNRTKMHLLLENIGEWWSLSSHCIDSCNSNIFDIFGISYRGFNALQGFDCHTTSSKVHPWENTKPRMEVRREEGINLRAVVIPWQPV